MLGEMRLQGSLYLGREPTLAGEMSEARLEEIVGSLPRGIYGRQTAFAERERGPPDTHPVIDATSDAAVISFRRRRASTMFSSGAFSSCVWKTSRTASRTASIPRMRQAKSAPTFAGSKTERDGAAPRPPMRGFSSRAGQRRRSEQSLPRTLARCFHPEGETHGRSARCR
jgi:hypothetical protein